MNWLIIPLAIATWSAAPIARAIAASVPDEVRPNRKRFSYARDALAIACVALGVIALFPSWAGIIAAALLIALRILFPKRWAVAAVAGFGLGLASPAPNALAAIAVPAALVAFLSGALARDQAEAITGTLALPIGATLVALALTLAV